MSETEKDHDDIVLTTLENIAELTRGISTTAVCVQVMHNEGRISDEGSDYINDAMSVVAKKLAFVENGLLHETGAKKRYTL